MDRGLEPDAQLRGVLITSLGRSSKWAEALSVLQDSIFSLNTLCFNAAITACEKGQQWVQALAVLDALMAVGVPADTVSFSGAISACEKCRQWERALALLGQLQRYHLVPDTIACSAAISACEKSGRWQQALSVLSTMLEERSRTDLVIFSAAISACEKGRKWQEALQLLRMALQRFRPDMTPYNAVISACAADGRNAWQMAVQLFSEAALHLSVDVLTGSSVIAACAEAREWQPALQLLKDLQQRRVELNIKVYNAAVTAASERPLIALQVVEEIDDSHLEPDVLTCMPPAEAIADYGFPPSQRQSQFTEVLASLVKATESALCESASQYAPTVLALDLLTDSGCFQACHGALQAQACRMILGPARPRLQGLMDASERREGHENEALRDPVLERHFSMGSMLTDEVLARSFPAGAAWRRPAAHQARSALQLCEEEVSFWGSVFSRGIAAWSGCSLQSPAVSDFKLRGRLCAFGEADPDFRRLAPILVEHDRSQHAERQAMLLLLDEVNAGIHGPKTCPDAADTALVAILQSILRLSSTAKQWARYALTSARVVVPVFLQRCFEEGLEV
ncbi:EMB2654 [Symbiodinium sp. CCMP2592]|nr:EMB2654 [Symbiodinium sp. CCMP2592]